MAWMVRGLRDGIVTTGYPRRPDGYGPNFKGAVEVLPAGGAPGSAGEAVTLCPTGAITADANGALELDRGRCILCGRCVAERPDSFAFTSSIETAAADRSALIVPRLLEDDAALAELRGDLARRVRALRRSIYIRHVDAGSDGAEEWEVAALTNPVYDVQRLGVFFTASPKHADVLLVTGVGAAGMEAPLRQTYDLMPEPKVVVAAGVDAASGGMVHAGYAARGGVAGFVPVDVYVPVSPPSPFGILHGILEAVGILGSRRHIGAEGPKDEVGAR